MKNGFNKRYFLLLLLLFPTFNSIAQATDWTKQNAEKWFEKQEWLNVGKPTEAVVRYDQFGRIVEAESPDTNSSKASYLQIKQLKPHESINKVEFAKQYHAVKQWWSEAFSYLEQTDLINLKPGKYAINADNVFATVTEGPAKLQDTTKWESHRNYQDIHYVIKGRERIGVAPVSSATVINPYDPARDLTFYKAAGKYYLANPGNFFIFFPQDAHRPNLRVDGDEIVKKIVIKVRRVSL